MSFCNWLTFFVYFFSSEVLFVYAVVTLDVIFVYAVVTTNILSVKKSCDFRLSICSGSCDFRFDLIFNIRCDFCNQSRCCVFRGLFA